MRESQGVRVLVADDDPVQRSVTSRWLETRGIEADIVADGDEAWKVLSSHDGPMLAVLDWMMPGIQGVELCRRVREETPDAQRFLILLTSRNHQEDIVSGLRAGADDYVLKPFYSAELEARFQNGLRLLQLRSKLEDRVRELQAALEDVRQLRGLLPICSYCKRVRNDDNYWTQVEAYLSERLDVRFSHGICPSCYDNVVKKEIDRVVEATDDSGP